MTKKVTPAPCVQQPEVERAMTLLVRLIDTFDNQVFGGEYPVTFGDMRMLIGYAEEALIALREKS